MCATGLKLGIFMFRTLLPPTFKKMSCLNNVNLITQAVDSINMLQKVTEIVLGAVYI